VPANSFNDRADYGLGIGIRVPRYRHILVKGRSWIGSRSSRKTSWSMEASARGTDSILYFGSADKLNREHLKKVKRLVKRTNTPGSPITCAGEASMGDMLMIFYPII